ncbi:MAG: cytochrome c peroxidase, partial [Acidobacteriota bacterium]
GTVLTASAIDRSSIQQTALWQLNIEANNKDKNKQTEPEIEGEVAFNRLSRVVLTSPLGSSVAVGSQHIDLDLANPTSNYDRNQSVGLPYAIDISLGGIIFITGLLTDNVVVLDPAGNWITEWDLPTGCIPRQVELDPTETVALVYCAGINKVPAYYLGTIPPTLVHGYPLDLGFDPTPAEIQEGRRLFYDGDFSEHNNASCATCHIEGGIDGLAWNLSNGEIDSKGPMTTQDLRAVNRLGPLHWRGEQMGSGEQRGMVVDFNDAFVGLLGSPRKLSEVRTGGQPSEFDKFEAFILSLEHTANPNQNEDRVLDDTIQPPFMGPGHQTASAINGQAVYLTGDFCSGCHALPTGSNNEIVPDGFLYSEPKPRRQEIVIQPLINTGTRAVYPQHQINLVGGATQFSPRVGPGTSHSGNPPNLFLFNTFFAFSNLVRSELTNFIYQLDTGLAPAVHRSVLFNQANRSAAMTRLNTYLIPQANQRNADIGVFGRLTIGSRSRIAAWVYDRVQGDFLGDDGTRQPLSFFASQVTNQNDWFAFVGLPVGMGTGWAIDFDRDQLFNALERTTPVDGRYVVDWDGDGFWDGHESLNGGDPFDPLVLPVDVTNPSVANAPLAADWTTARVARLRIEASELSIYSLTLTPPGGTGLPPLSYVASEPRMLHNIVVHNLYPGQQNYSATLTLRDLAGLPSSTQNFTVQSSDFNDGAEMTVIEDLEWTGPPSGSGTVTFQAKAKVTKKTSGPPRQAAFNRVMVLRALINGKPASSSNLSVPAGQGTDFCVNQVRYSTLTPFGEFPPPFIITKPTNGSGITAIDFTLSGLSPRDVVTLVPEAISSLDLADRLCTGSSTDPNLKPIVPGPAPVVVPFNWSFPDTPKENRKLEFVHP